MIRGIRESAIGMMNESVIGMLNIIGGSYFEI